MAQLQKPKIGTSFINAAWIAFVGLCCVCLGASLLLSRTVEAQFRATPFYLERTIVTADKDGSLQPARTEILARRSDGTTAHLKSVGPVGSQQYMRKVIYSDGRVTTFVDAIKAKVTWPKLPAEDIKQFQERLSTSRNDCGARPPYSIVRFDNFKGIKVVVIQYSPTPQYKITRWLAPSMGCEDLYYKTEKLNSDGTYKTSAEATVSQLSLGEPDSRWFAQGQGEGFTEMRPSEAQKRLVEQMGLKLGEVEAYQAGLEGEKADRTYQGKGGSVRPW